jgi:flagellar biosynthesis/type III secretory pathway M-ring protein FliF/YscJ
MIEENVLKILGGNAKVAVRVELSSARKEMEQKTYDKDPREVHRSKRSETKSGKTDSAPASIKTGGMETLDSLPGVSTTEDSDLSESEVYAVVGETKEKTSTPPGEILKSSITVIIPVLVKEGENAEAVLTARQKELPAIEAQVQNATGIKQENISVGFIAAAPPRPILGPTGWELFQEFFREWGGTIFLWGLAAFALLVLYFVIKKAMPRDVMSEIEELRKKMGAEAVAAAEMPAPEHELTRMKMTIKNMVSKNPRGVANILKRWLSGK